MKKGLVWGAPWDDIWGKYSTPWHPAEPGEGRAWLDVPAAPGIAAGFCEELVINPTWFCLSYWAAFSKNSSCGVSSPRRYQKGWPREIGQLLVSSQKNLTEEQRSFSRSSGTVRPLCLALSFPPLCCQWHHPAPNKAHICVSSDFSGFKPCLLSPQHNQDESQHCKWPLGAVCALDMDFLFCTSTTSSCQHCCDTLTQAGVFGAACLGCSSPLGVDENSITYLFPLQ